MSDNNKPEEFLQKLAPCIERGELEMCVEEAARLAGEMGIGAGELFDLATYGWNTSIAGDFGELRAEELFDLATYEWDSKKREFAYVLVLAAAQSLEGDEKAHAFYDAGLAAHFLGKLKESDEHYKKAIEINPEDETVHNNYALLLTQSNRKNEAEKHYKKAIEINPNFAEAHFNYAEILIKLNRKNEAEVHYKKAIEINPKFTVAYNNYANLLREKAQFSEAEKEIRVALQIELENPYALGTLGDILADEGDFEEAIKEYHKALKNSVSMECPTTSEIHNNLGWVYAQLKQHNKAKEEFKKALVLDSMNIKAICNLRKLGKIEAVPEFSRIQICLGILLLLPLIESYYLFWISKLSETMFVAQSTILIALLIFIILYHQLARFKAGPFEFEKGTEHKLMEAKSQPSEFER